MQRLFLLTTCLLFFLPLSIQAAIVDTSSKSFTTPSAFMDLYYDFTGNHDKDYPKGKINASSALIKKMVKEGRLKNKPGSLILFVNSSFYIYDERGKKLVGMQLRASKHSGFYPMTAISHIGPALAYYAKAKELGSDTWRQGLKNMLKHIKAIRSLNHAKQNNWIERLASPAWEPHQIQIQDMVDYACAKSGNYIASVLKGKPFTTSSLNKDFISGTSKDYPIPYNNVMVGTFMLTALETINEIYQQVSKLDINWADAKVIIRSLAGKNVTAGLTTSSNWLVPLIITLSQGKLKPERIFIAPYAKALKALGQDKLPKDVFDYYQNQVWGAVYTRTQMAKLVFKTIPDIKIQHPKPIPGDFIGTNASDMMSFMMRLKYSLATPTQMLSNTVGFWMVGEFHAKQGDIIKIRVPGLTTGFPKGVKTYPYKNPEIIS